MNSKSRLYRIHKGMKQRCYNPHYPWYHRYGGRGITVCDEWREDFAAFRDWALANGYTDELTIDRIDNDGNYCPENCQWITCSDNASKASRSKNSKNKSFRVSENGWYLMRSSGAHDIYYSPITGKRFSVPRHAKEIAEGTLKSIKRDAGLE